MATYLDYNIDIGDGPSIEFSDGIYASDLSALYIEAAFPIDFEPIEFSTGLCVSNSSKVYASPCIEIGIESFDGSEDIYVRIPSTAYFPETVTTIVSVLPRYPGDDVIIIVIGISVDFSADPRFGPAPLSVQFTNLSSGAVEEFRWLFGDGEVSNDSEPQHIYRHPGQYDVTLRIRVEGQWFETTKLRYIIVYPGGLIVSRTNRSFAFAILSDQGIGPSENTGAYPMPESGDNALMIFDDDDQPHLLVLDNGDGFFYDIMQRDGPPGSGISKCWDDKVGTDGTGGTAVAPIVGFGADVGTFEHYWLKHLLSYVFARAADDKYRGAAGYDSNGFPTGLEILLRLFVDGERVTPDRIVKDIPITGSIHTDDAVQGHRIQLELEANMGAHAIVGRKQEYMVTDKYIGDGIMTEDDYQEEFATPLTWFSRELHDVDRATGGSMAAAQYAKCSTCAGPDGESDSALSFTEAVVFPTSIALSNGTFMLWHQSLDSVKVGNTTISLTEYGRSGDWILSRATGVTATGVVTITPTGTGKIFDGPRAYNSAISAGAIEYYYDNIVDKGGDVVLP